MISDWGFSIGDFRFSIDDLRLAAGCFARGHDSGRGRLNSVVNNQGQTVLYPYLISDHS